ncbi:HD domain-containing protein [Dactylosporangium roseum]|uniref:HD domain-containing protein n=1 Tax=Dactylosporangium roseum TaxID=47989 RepID=A0ABY5Z8I9_9ACTN|nr:HD domain-containing protein [Dactylosporangium roseum]UWZ37777.1 HD domain-containing protein [Dactylosporangium roseum]
MSTQILADRLVDLARLSLLFGTIDRITFHADGTTPESDTDHTVMLGLAACAFATEHVPGLRVGLVAQFALVHDLVEAYAGDMPTLRALSSDQKAQKKAREHAAYSRIMSEFGLELPWIDQTISEYERQLLPEARFVRALDKLMPKLTHILNDCTTLRAQGVTVDELRARYEMQEQELLAYAADFPVLMELRAELVDRVLAAYAGTEVAA